MTPTATKTTDGPILREAPRPQLPATIEQAAARLDQIASSYYLALQDEAMGHLGRAMLLASGIARLREAITKEVMAQFMALMNSPLGFKTDRPNKKNPQPYSETEVRDCLIAGLLQGAYPVNNELNIIAAGCYLAQNYYRRKMRETPGMTDLKIAPGIPIQHNGHTVVRMSISWKLNGVPDQLKGADGKPGLAIPIITTDYSTADATIGKAIRKGLKAAYLQIHGSEHTMPDEDDSEVIDVPAPGKSRTEDLAERLRQKEPTRETPATGQQPAEGAPEPSAAPPSEVGDEPDDPDFLLDDLRQRIDQCRTEADVNVVAAYLEEQRQAGSLGPHYAELHERLKAKAPAAGRRRTAKEI